MDSDLLILLILAVVQGVTEFLPISSSGHLVVVASLLGSQAESSLDIADVNIVLHLGTLASIVLFYFHRILRLVGEDKRVIPLLIAGTLPAVAVGLPIELFFDEVLESRWIAGSLLIVTGLMLIWVSRFPHREGNYQSLTWMQTLAIGVAQAAAILPGLSRSGSTISAGLRCGLSRESAATFSFLLAIPVIAGGGVLKLLRLMTSDAPNTTPPGYLALGAVVAFVVGLVSLWWLVRWLEKGRLQWFAAWCIPLGIFVLVREWMM